MLTAACSSKRETFYVDRSTRTTPPIHVCSDGHTHLGDGGTCALSHNIPDNIQQSLDEARRSLDIANYRSSVAMSRRTLEAVLKFGYERLLKKQPINKKGRELMLNDMIQEFRNQNPPSIPDHLLHVADSIRVIGNVPGAHAADIPEYHFSRSDAEFALYATIHFLDQYFAKIDPEVTKYYRLTIDLNESSAG